MVLLKRSKSSRHAGLTLMEVMLTLFVVMVGLVGILAALPTGMASAEKIILQDAAIHLAESKFAEFRRDRINPVVDLKDGLTPSLYMAGAVSKQGQNHSWNGSYGGVGFRDFTIPASPTQTSPLPIQAGDPYIDFDNIERYEWMVRQDLLNPVGAATGDAANSSAGSPAGTGATEAGMSAPTHSGVGIDKLMRVVLVVQLKGTGMQFVFTQYMTDPGRASKQKDGLWEDDYAP